MRDLFSDLPPSAPDRVIGWFSCGVTSAVAIALELPVNPEMEIVRIRIGTEHEDSDRFARECERKLFRRTIVTLTPPDGDHFAVIRRTRYIKGPHGARCSGELKRAVREAYQRPGDLHVFGFDALESDRVADFRENNPGLPFKAPLLESGLLKQDCKRVIERAGIELPAMYRLGYANNNCVGCVKGGMGYWNRIRTDFPDVFARMSALEGEIGATILRYRSGPQKGERLPLALLDPTAGRFEEDQPSECGVLCESALARVGLGEPASAG